MSWREVLAENFDTHNTHNTHNPIETHSSADIADIAYGNSQIPEDRDKARTVIEVTATPAQREREKPEHLFSATSYTSRTTVVHQPSAVSRTHRR